MQSQGNPLNTSKSVGKFVAIWQSDVNVERHFVRRLLEPYISEHILDGKHELVLDNAILIDAWVYTNDPNYYAGFHGKNAFLFHLSDELYELGSECYVHFRGVFRSYWSSVFNPEHVMILPVGPTSIDPDPSPIVQASKRLYSWSFAGQADKCSRPDMVRSLQQIEPHLCYSTTPVDGLGFWRRNSDSGMGFSREEFVQVLKQSVFAPSPMGNANLESFRVYEALEAGSIPIVERRLSLDYFRSLLGDHPLPSSRSWREARCLMLHLLQSPGELDDLQQRCFQWWKSYQAELVTRIGHFLDERAAVHGSTIPLRSRIPALPGWQYFELLRHQSVSSLLRRIKLQLNRVLRGQGWRQSHSRSRGMYGS